MFGGCCMLFVVYRVFAALLFAVCWFVVSLCAVSLFCFICRVVVLSCCCVAVLLFCRVAVLLFYWCVVVRCVLLCCPFLCSV